MKHSKSWLQGAVIYNIFIDRFSVGKDNDELWSQQNCDAPVFCGGNIQGVIERLDYLSDLGINTILLTPFHKTINYHGYSVMDFFSVDPRFGSIDKIKELISEARKRNIRIILDLVMNHVSQEHPYFVDAQNNPQSPYRDWFYFRNWPNDYLTYLTFRELPKLNLENPDTRDHVIDAALFWLEMGFDGFRLDHIIAVPYSFFKEMHKQIKMRNPDAVIIGEAVKGELFWAEIKTLKTKNKYFLYLLSRLGFNINMFMQLQYTKYFDGLIDFSFRDIIKKFFIEKRFYYPKWLFPIATKIYYWLYPKNFALISLLENADKDRLLFVLNNDKDKYKEIVSAQMSLPQPAIVFYGAEVGLKQYHSRHEKPLGDLAIRSKMPWSNVDEELLKFFKSVCNKKIHKSKH